MYSRYTCCAMFTTTIDSRSQYSLEKQLDDKRIEIVYQCKKLLIGSTLPYTHGSGASSIRALGLREYSFPLPLSLTAFSHFREFSCLSQFHRDRYTPWLLYTLVHHVRLIAYCIINMKALPTIVLSLDCLSPLFHSSFIRNLFLF